MKFKNVGLVMLILGFILIIFGALFFLSGNYFSWLGNLSGDIKIERENFTLYLPITTMILVSVILNIVIRIFYYFFR